MAVVIPALDARYVTTVSLDEYFVNKDTGLPLANGRIYFYEDSNRNVPKLVYTLVDNPPGYNPPNYTPLPNPITLSTVGTVADNNGNNVPIYYFPYDADGNLQLYYIVITDQFGTVQETRHAWPNISAAENPAAQSGNFVNTLSNPQFSQVLFLPNNPLTITNAAGAGLVTYNLFPDWFLDVTWSGNGTIVISRTAVAGSSAYPGNPPYTITITPGVNITRIALYQRLSNNPNIFAASGASLGGYISASLLLAPGSSIVQMLYAPNGLGALSVVILNANNTSGNYEEFTQTTQLPPAVNPATADTGFVDIVIDLPITQATTLSNVQIIGLEANIEGITWSEYPINRQTDQLFNYWQTYLNYKPTTSYLIGWNFPYNPAQFLGRTVGVSAAGNNTSRYVWDQTIVFQSVNNGVTIAPDLNGNIVLTAALTTQLALIQYLPQETARQILSNDIAGAIAGQTSGGTSISGKISLWYTTDVALPNINVNASLVATLDATGKPGTFNGNWTEVFRGGTSLGSSLGDAKFTIIGNNGFTAQFMPFSGWNVSAAAPLVPGTATFFAIVVGFESLLAGRQINIASISLNAGKIATIPAAKSASEVLMDCQRYYQKSFSYTTIPAQNVGLNSGDYQFKSASNALGAVGTFMESKTFIPPMYITPTMTFYNPGAADAQCWDYFAVGSTSATATVSLTAKSFVLQTTGNAGAGQGDRLGVHWTADARLGI